MTTPVSLLFALGVAGLLAGLGLLVRGLRAQRTAARIGDIAASPIGTLAAGEVLITGEAVAAGVTLTSRLRRRTCLYYRSVIRDRTGRGERTVLDEQRAIGFFVRDRTGEIRVFPRDARWEVPLDDETDELVAGEWTDAGSVPLPVASGSDPLHPGRTTAPDFAMSALVGSASVGPLGAADPAYREARIEPGATVTIVGRAIPFRELADPTEADRGGELDTLTGAVDPGHIPDLADLQDPEVAAAYVRARDQGILVDPATAWGNAAIEGFGIGRPVRPANLDPVARVSRPELAVASTAAAGPTDGAATAATPGASADMSADPGGARDPRAVAPRPAAVERSFQISPDALVVAAGPGVALLIAAGSPDQAWARDQRQFLVGLLGAALAIGGALLAALALSGAFGPFAGP